MEQLKTFGRELAMSSQGGWSQSKEFLDLVKSIGECRSKAEEDRIVLSEIETLKRRISDPDVPKRKMKEYIIRLVYVEMLGHDASFGHIHAVKMTHDDSLLLKRTGYLAVTLFLNEDHDLIILIVNTIQKDLKSDNYLVVCAALNAVCKLINEETIPAVLPHVVELLGHAKEAVRKKAIMALHRFYRRSPSSVSHLVSNFRKRLCDNDPGVMGASLCPLFDLISADVNSYKEMVISLIGILKQIAERRLPKSYDYHQMPAPFIQIKLLKILALLGCGDKRTSEHMHAVLGDIFRKCESTSNIGNAVLYECICTVSSIYPSAKLLEAAAEVTSRFLKSDNHNLRYLGIDALRRLIKISPDIAEEHQLAVIDCLEDPDDTLKRRTFDLLHKMTKSTNVEVIIDRMIDYMINISDKHYKTEIANRCVELAEQFAPNNRWFIQTMNKVFEHAGDLVNTKVAHNLMRLIAEGFGEDDEGADSQLRSSAVESYLVIMGEPKLPSVFLQVICWVLGEYGIADGKYSASYITGKLCDVAEAHPNDDIVKGYSLTGIMKICAFEVGAGRKVDLLPECQSLIHELSASHSTDLQQRAYEVQALLGVDASAMKSIMPIDASCESIEVDKDLSFLETFVRKALDDGARPYVPESERLGAVGSFGNQDHHDAPTHALKFEAYNLPTIPMHPVFPQNPTMPSPTEIAALSNTTSQKEMLQTIALASASETSSDAGLKLKLDGVQKKWGRPTYSPQPSSSSSQKNDNGIVHVESNKTSSSQTKEVVFYDLTKQQPEVSAEKQRLAASLFGASSSTSEKKTQGVSKTSRGTHLRSEKAKQSTNISSAPVQKAAPVQPPPDLLDLGDDPVPKTTTIEDPFKQLEGLMGPPEIPPTTNSEAAVSSPPPVNNATQAFDLMTLYTDTPESMDLFGGLGVHVEGTISGTPSTVPNNGRNVHAGNPASPVVKKGPSVQDSLEKHAIARQVGVTPSGTNPNFFKDLLG